MEVSTQVLLHTQLELTALRQIKRCCVARDLRTKVALLKSSIPGLAKEPSLPSAFVVVAAKSLHLHGGILEHGGSHSLGEVVCISADISLRYEIPISTSPTESAVTATGCHHSWHRNRPLESWCFRHPMLNRLGCQNAPYYVRVLLTHIYAAETR